jgi:hypothetical protein
MPKSIGGPTWALLPPSNLPSEGERRTLLGSIVADFEHPLAQYVPENASKVVPQKLLCKPTEDTNFKVALTNARGQGAHARLGDILQASLRKDVNNEMHLSTTIVQTYELKQQDQIFELLKKRFKNEILGMIDRAPSRNKGSVFMIVAIKTCANAQISSQGSKDVKTSIDANMPTTALVMATTGAPMATNLDIGAGISGNETSTAEESQVAKGARIFAIQYRVIKRQSVWIHTKRPRDIDMGDYLVPKGNSMFGDEKDKEGERAEDQEDQESIEELLELEDEEDEDEADPIQLGDLQHTWALGSSADSGVIMATL